MFHFGDVFIDKYVSKVIKTYTLNNEHGIKNSKDFIEKVKPMRITKEQRMVSFDVAALYPSVPQDQALDLFEEYLKNDKDLKSKTPIPAKELMKLFRTCLKMTYFVFNSKLYVQIDGLAIGASSSVFLAEIFMMKLEKKALSTFANPPDFWYRYVDDTFTYMLETYIEGFLAHLNNQHPRIKFTIEQEENRQIPFLDTLLTVEENGTISTKIYRKKTHTDQYLHFNSNHHAGQKLGIVSTLKKRMEIITKEQDKVEEEEHIEKAFRSCGYPEWAVKRKNKEKKKSQLKEDDQVVARVSIPYTKGLSEKISRQMRKHNIETIHKPTTTIKNILCSKAKDRLNPMDKPGALYYINCKAHGVDYVGETGRAVKERMYEHRVVSHDDMRRSHSLIVEKEKPEERQIGERKSARQTKKIDYKAMHTGSNIAITTGSTVVSEHMALNDHEEGDIDIKILGFENNWYKRTTKEAIAIKRIKPTLNEDEGRYISPIFDPVPSKFTRSRLVSQADDVTSDGSNGARSYGDAIMNHF